MSHYQTIARALAYIRAHVQEQPDLDEVAASVCLSPYHFQRAFTEWAGVSPKKFLQFLTLKHAKAALARNATLSEAAGQSGLSGTGRLHDLFLTLEGITPGEYKNRAEKTRITYSLASCQFGDYVVASTARGICYLHFYEDEQLALQEMRQYWPKAQLCSHRDQQHEQVNAFFTDKAWQPEQKLNLHLKGTPFQLKVWEALLKIPEGRFTSYATLAQHIKQPSAARAVGTAIGSNPIAFLIPCHRVIKSVGGIGEYRWGPERKMAMLGWEAAQAGATPLEKAETQLPLFK
ncbi:DNA-O6-methylguanine--protein-cysteine S-methyltransferase /transcriptional regulator Ada [Pontibacter ummariensis]|uniref:methylated-DNA--[protein]-cysteine S-methyltransferase n=1 Tax=Pontibacter ummariensis TaxID=1610492 RepID=A0A239FSS9_9BACT|nr:methylated-DNA--[protein]-cysteine S-methyltransferase [Pontibacter ummariensis]PRY11974.1 DNA-O6-methylguanine--protein-cysteine S-methyltransferase /transcriptional regulator Ada [Pontibacter ummariensis]SNS58934.1 DNA-O6-methylguanine--protein-cysteine S-methyltransferase /Transcriptional regulator Ada [Pontibacter ummariensis]